MQASPDFKKRAHVKSLVAVKASLETKLSFVKSYKSLCRAQGRESVSANSQLITDLCWSHHLAAGHTCCRSFFRAELSLPAHCDDWCRGRSSSVQISWTDVKYSPPCVCAACITSVPDITASLQVLCGHLCQEAGLEHWTLQFSAQRVWLWFSQLQLWSVFIGAESFSVDVSEFFKPVRKHLKFKLCSTTTWSREELSSSTSSVELWAVVLQSISQFIATEEQDMKSWRPWTNFRGQQYPWQHTDPWTLRCTAVLF